MNLNSFFNNSLLCHLSNVLNRSDPIINLKSESSYFSCKRPSN